MQENLTEELIKKIISENKTTLLSLWNQEWKKVKVETEKIYILLPNIPTDISELNKLIYAGTKLIRDKIGMSQRNPNRNSKLGN